MAKKQGKPGVKKGQKVKTKRFSIQGFDVEHYKRTEQYASAVQTLFDRATVAITNAAAKGQYNPDKPFSFADYPSVQSVMQKTIEGLANGVTAVIETGSRKQWLFANQKNDAFLASIADTSKVSPAKMKKWQDKNLDALQAFQERKIDGMNLSQRVWKYVGQYKDQIELGLDVGLGEGRSAAQLARDVKENLREPNKLFRRVRDKHGNLHLSKAAKAYHPGQGVYRSSVKNAQRLTRSEINMAYRESDFLRWQNLDFVVGFEIHRSTHEPLCKCKLCERLVGRYPKTFKFKGWHPQCMCYATPILMDEATRNENEQAELKAALTGKPYKPKRAKNEVLDVPDGFKAWVAENVAAQENWASTPYFIADNFIDGQLSLGLKQDLNDGGVKTIMQAIEVAKGFGIGHIDFGDATVEQANIILEALQEEYDFFGEAGIPLDSFTLASKYKGSKKEGGHYSPSENGIVMNLDIFNDEADSGKSILEKIASLEAQRAKLQADIDKWTAKLGINPAADKMLKQDIKMMKSKMTDIEIKIQGFQKDIAAGHDEISLTYGYSLKDLKDRVKATIHHEFGHLFDYKFNDAQGYAGNAYNSTYAKTTDKEALAEWYAQWMMGNKEGIPQELLDAFEGKTAVDAFKPQLMAIMPQIEQARQIAQEWGLSTSQIDVGIQNKNMHSITTGIEQIINTGQKLLQDVNAWIAKIMPLMQEAMNHGIPVSHYAVLMKKLQGNHSNWVFDKVSYTSAITELQDAISEAKDNEKLSTLLVDVADAKAQFGSDAVHAVYDAVEKKLAQWNMEDGSLAYLKKKLNFEIQWLEKNQKHSTWQVAQKAYQKKLDEVNYQYEKEAIEQQAQTAIAYLLASKSLKGKALCKQFQNLMATNTPISLLQDALDELNAKYQEQMAKDNAKKAKAASSQFAVNEFKGKIDWSDASMYDQKRKDAAMWVTEPSLADVELRGVCMKIWGKTTAQEKKDAWDYTEGSAFINEPLRKQYYSGRKGDRGVEAGKRLAKVIDGCAYNFDMWLVRGVDESAFEALFSISTSSIINKAMSTKGPKEDITVAINRVARAELLGKEGTEHAFSSCGNAKGKGFSARPVIYNVYCPKGTKMLYMEPFSYYGYGVNGKPAWEMNCDDGLKWDGITPQSGFGSEAECLLQKETTFRITKVEYVGSSPYNGKWYIDVYVVNQ